jgi:hypothetical protein
MGTFGGFTVSLDMDAFGGAVFSLSSAISSASETTGIPREQLCAALYRQAKREKNKRESEMWRNAATDKELGAWIYRDAGRKFGSHNEGEILQFASTIPKLTRNGLIKIAKNLRVQGGKRRKLQRWEVLQAKFFVARLKEKNSPLSKEKIYAKVAKRFKVSLNTIRRECEPKERERTRRPIPKDSVAHNSRLDMEENGSDW